MTCAAIRTIVRQDLPYIQQKLSLHSEHAKPQVGVEDYPQQTVMRDRLFTKIAQEITNIIAMVGSSGHHRE